MCVHIYVCIYILYVYIQVTVYIYIYIYGGVLVLGLRVVILVENVFALRHCSGVVDLQFLLHVEGVNQQITELSVYSIRGWYRHP